MVNTVDLIRFLLQYDILETNKLRNHTLDNNGVCQGILSINEI